MKRIVLLDNVRSAFNVGSIFRTADGANWNEIVLCGITPYPPNPKLLKTALGSTEYVQWKRFNTTLEGVEYVKSLSIPIYSIEQSDNSIMFDERTINYPDDLCIVFGHELLGVDKNILELSDKVIELPMLGKKNSLNVGVTAGIVMYYINARTK